MATPDGRWIVEVIRTRLAKSSACASEPSSARTAVRGWAPIGKIRLTVAEVAELLGDDFIELVYRP
jgi:hypothetical protein